MELYSAKVLAKRDHAVTLEVHTVHPDAPAPRADPGWSLMLLREAAEHPHPLHGELSMQDATDDAFMQKYARGYIAKVTVAPSKARARTAATVEIAVTDPAWIAHLTAGQQWNSTAFSGVQTYDAHAPIHPGQAPAAAATDDEEGYLLVPAELFLPEVAPTPFVRLPAYGPSAYRAVDEIEKPTEAQLTALVGQPVRLDDGDPIDGVLFVANGASTVAGAGSRSGGSIDRLDRVARLRFDPSAKRTTKLRYADALQHLPTVVTAAQRVGSTLTLTIAPARNPSVSNHADILRHLVTPLLETGTLDDKSTAPLAVALRRDGVGRSKDYATFANGYIASATWTPAHERTVPALDGASHADVRAALAAPRPTGTLEIEVTDAHWLDHFEDVQLPFLLSNSKEPAAERWNGPPRTWTPPPPVVVDPNDDGFLQVPIAFWDQEHLIGPDLPATLPAPAYDGDDAYHVVEEVHASETDKLRALHGSLVSYKSKLGEIYAAALFSPDDERVNCLSASMGSISLYTWNDFTLGRLALDPSKPRGQRTTLEELTRLSSGELAQLGAPPSAAPAKPAAKIAAKPAAKKSAKPAAKSAKPAKSVAKAAKPAKPAKRR